jgi:hypothetical protein
VLALLSLLAPQATGQSSAEPRRIVIQVELRADDEWKTVDPATIFESGAQVRFRVKTNFAGYLYVMNQGTSGAYTLLFPREDTGSQNRFEAGREYVVPATSGAFRITGPAGQDIVYWMVTPLDVAPQEAGRSRPGYVPLPPAPPPGAKMHTLLPRCDDAVFRARGECVDSSAGPRKVADASKLPENFKDVPGLKSRELVFIRQQNAAVVSSPASGDGPVIYEFRLAHK